MAAGDTIPEFKTPDQWAAQFGGGTITENQQLQLLTDIYAVMWGIYQNGGGGGGGTFAPLAFITHANVNAYPVNTTWAAFNSGYLIYGNSLLQYQAGGGAPANGFFTTSIAGGVITVTVNVGGVVAGGQQCYLIRVS